MSGYPWRRGAQGKVFRKSLIGIAVNPVCNAAQDQRGTGVARAQYRHAACFHPTARKSPEKIGMAYGLIQATPYAIIGSIATHCDAFRREEKDIQAGKTLAGGIPMGSVRFGR
jgi:hypothetical protein